MNGSAVHGGAEGLGSCHVCGRRVVLRRTCERCGRRFCTACQARFVGQRPVCRTCVGEGASPGAVSSPESGTL